MSAMDEHGLLFDAMIYLAAAVVIVPIAKRFGLGSVLGYLGAGCLIGPFAGEALSVGERIRWYRAGGRLAPLAAFIDACGSSAYKPPTSAPRGALDPFQPIRRSYNRRLWRSADRARRRQPWPTRNRPRR